MQCACTFVIYYFIYLCWTFIPDIKFEFRMWMSSNAWLKSSLHTWNNFNLDDDDARKHSSVSPFPPGCSHPWPGLQSPDLLLLPQASTLNLGNVNSGNSDYLRMFVWCQLCEVSAVCYAGAVLCTQFCQKCIMITKSFVIWKQFTHFML